MQMVAGRIQGLIGFVRKINIGNWMGRLIVALKATIPST
jgi:hypothetical protein